jgi:hypothetical protein
MENSSSFVASAKSSRSDRKMSFKKAWYAVFLENHRPHGEEDERGVLRGNHVGDPARICPRG